jgi:hypothetical protein
MLNFDFNDLTEEQICSKAMGKALIAEDQLFFENALTKEGFYDISEEEYAAARAGAEAVVESVNRALKPHGLAIKRADMVEYMAWILVPKTAAAEKTWIKSLTE